MTLLPNALMRVETIEGYRAFDEIIDVRTPAEFEQDHIPGSTNYPVLDNEQRIEVGTLYQQHSPFAAKRIGAAYVAENIGRLIQNYFQDRPQHWNPLIVCWRGGQRSGSLTLVFRKIGWNAMQLAGGYKRYRKQVLEQLDQIPQRLSFRVICGQTGSGKSFLLQRLAQCGEQVLDLEKLASHKGSVLGPLPDIIQPSQKMFETRLVQTLLDFDPERPVYVEAESRKLGMLYLPNTLLQKMRIADCLSINVPFEARVDFLLGDYAYLLDTPEQLLSRLETLRHILGIETFKRWKAYVDRMQWRELVSELLLQHYDPLYKRSQKQNYSSFNTNNAFDIGDLSVDRIDHLIAQIRQRLDLSIDKRLHDASRSPED